jgi:hypothetical protein
MEISARVLAHSKCAITGKEILTMEWVYPRLVLAEINTHKMLVKNSASSRAIPIAKVIEQVRNNPAMPSQWGKNQPGMSAREELTGLDLKAVQEYWVSAANYAAASAEAMDMCSAHKQVANRILEPFQWMKTVITGTEWDNFWYLRNHPDADPTLHALAKVAYADYKKSIPQTLQPGQWHTPYVYSGRHIETGEYVYYIHGDESKGEPYQIFLTLEEALKVSSSCCAQTSFRTSDDTLDKAIRLYDRLVESKPVHASPFEHQATPMQPVSWKTNTNLAAWPQTWQEGITHVDRKGKFWSAGFCGFVQHRQLIPDHTCWEYKGDEV